MSFAGFTIVCFCAVYGGKTHCSISARGRLLIYWLCQRIPSDQVQFRSPALISSAHQGSFSPSCSPPPPLANADLTIGLNHIWQFKSALFSYVPCASKHLSKTEWAPVLPPDPDFLALIYLCARACVRVCVIISESYSVHKKGTKRPEPSNDRATLIRHYSV